MPLRICGDGIAPPRCLTTRERRRAFRAPWPGKAAWLPLRAVTCIMQLTGHNFPAMRRKSIEKASCPIARSLERVGDWWTMLILRDELHGFARFEEFRDSLGVAPNILAARLTRLV